MLCAGRTLARAEVPHALLVLASLLATAARGEAHSDHRAHDDHAHGNVLHESRPHHRCIHDRLDTGPVPRSTQRYHFMHDAQGEHDGTTPVHASARKLRRQWGDKDDSVWSAIRFHVDTSLMATATTDGDMTCQTTAETVTIPGSAATQCIAGWIMSDAARKELLDVIIWARMFYAKMLYVYKTTASLQLWYLHNIVLLIMHIARW